MNLAPAHAQAHGLALARLIAGQVCLHECMVGMRITAPLLVLREGAC